MSEKMECSQQEESEGNSDDNLEIVVESPNSKRKPPAAPTESERKIIESMEDEFERTLDEKAAKTNLNAVNVKNILRQVVTNEDVLTFVRNIENPKIGVDSSPVFEPKWTRAKVKELGSVPGVPRPPVPWVAQKPPPEVQALFTEDLQEDSSGDEYVPGMGDEEKEDLEESEDDPDSSFFSDPPSVEPPTPPEPPPAPSTPPPALSSCSNSDNNTSWTVDGIFKIPSVPKDKEEGVDEATIARRTRSKLCLSSTPLEVIEGAFIPPDITTDMYEMDCDNEDWTNFLKTFSRPLAEVDKVPEEEELDPEYNVLSDEEIDRPDKEELRVDKAVKVSKKELNNLIAELYEFCSTEQAYLTSIEEDEVGSSSFLNNTQVPDASNMDRSRQESSFIDETVTPKEESNPNVNPECEVEDKVVITDLQIALLGQQIRQHVQLLTQNFLLTHQHPELHRHSAQMKEYLINFKLLAGDKENSAFNAINLNAALDMVKYWEDLLLSNTDDVKNMNKYIEKVICESLRYKQIGSEYIVTFPPLILETISKSNIFLYPALLPKIPFKSPRFFTAKKPCFTAPERQLIALGLEQFEPIVTAQFVGKKGKISMRKIIRESSAYIHQYMLPIKNTQEIINQIYQNNYSRCGENPIKYYFQCNRAPMCLQYFMPLEELQILPPCKRQPEELPYQWRSYIFPQKKVIITQLTPITIDVCAGIQLFTKPPFSIQKSIVPDGPLPASPVRPARRKKIHKLPNGTLLPTPLRPSQRKKRLKRSSPRQRLIKSKLVYFRQDPITKFVDCLSKPSCIYKVVELYSVEYDLKHILTENTDRLLSPNKKTVNKRRDFVARDTELTTDSSVSENSDCKRLSTKIGAINNQVKSNKGSILSCTMLPNMPSLCTPVKIDSQSEESDGAADGKSVDLAKRNITLEISEVGVSTFQSTSSQSLTDENYESGKHEKDIPKENHEEMNASFIASSTVKPATRKEPSGAEKKRAKLKKEFIANLAISTPEDRAVEKQKNEMFAMAYYDKMRETLEIEAYHKIMQILNDYEEGDAVDLYHKIEAILRPKYKELADEFLLFLREREAAAVGRLVPWIRMNNRSKFLRKLEIYFKDQPAQLRKIYQCLTELTQTAGVSMEKIKTTLIPMFKGNAVLTDLFLQNFLDEPPPPSLLEGPYEVFEVNKKSVNDHEEPYETITVPDVEDRYGGGTCICGCHEIEDVEFKSRFRHCSKCGTKFLNGKVYIQTGRGLRPASVSFLTSPNVDHHARLADKSSHYSFIHRRKRSESSPSKQVNHPSAKDNPDEETDEDGDKKKKPKRKPQRSRKPKSAEDNDAKGPQKKTPPRRRSRNLNKEFKSSPRKRTSSAKKSNASPKIEHVETELEEPTETEQEEQVETEVEEQIEIDFEDKSYTKPGSSDGQQKRLHEESCEEGDQSAAGESSGEVKLGSPEQQTAESESEFCEESSQDNCESDSNSSTSSTINRSHSYANVLGQNSSWRREEDKIILEVFQMENDKDNAFKAIANQLKNRTVDEIKSRFDTLMDLLMKTVEDHRD